MPKIKRTRTRTRTRRRVARQTVETEVAQTGLNYSDRHTFLTAHLNYLKDELDKHSDKPDVQRRLKERIKITKQELKAT